jgi:hypothetical protein
MRAHRFGIPLFWIVYSIIALFVLLRFLPQNALNVKPIPIIRDTTISSVLTADIAKDRNGDLVVLTRMFHNKLFFLGHDLFISAIRPLDPVYLLSLSDRQFYGDETGLLPFWEFPFFLLALWLFFSKKLYKRKLVKMVCLGIIISDILLAFFLPRLSVIYLPFIVVLHIFIGMCIFDGLLRTHD